MLSQPGKNPTHPISLVGSELVGPTTRVPVRLRNLHSFHDLREDMSFVNLAGSDLRVQRHAVAIADEMDLGAETASGAA